MHSLLRSITVTLAAPLLALALALAAPSGAQAQGSGASSISLSGSEGFLGVLGGATVVLGADVSLLFTDLHYGSRGLPLGLALTEITWGVVHLGGFGTLAGLLADSASWDGASKAIVAGSVAWGAVGLAEVIHGIWSLTRGNPETDGLAPSPGLSEVSWGLAPTEGGGLATLSGRF